MSASLPCSPVPPFYGGPPGPLQTSCLTRDASGVLYPLVLQGTTTPFTASWTRLKKISKPKWWLNDFPLWFLFANYLLGCLNCFRFALICAFVQICSVDCPLSVGEKAWFWSSWQSTWQIVLAYRLLSELFVSDHLVVSVLLVQDSNYVAMVAALWLGRWLWRCPVPPWLTPSLQGVMGNPVGWSRQDAPNESHSVITSLYSIGGCLFVLQWWSDISGSCIVDFMFDSWFWIHCICVLKVSIRVFGSSWEVNVMKCWKLVIFFHAVTHFAVLAMQFSSADHCHLQRGTIKLFSAYWG